MAHPLLLKAPHELSYSTDPQAVTTVVTRTNATQYLVLDSKNRNQTTQVNALKTFNDNNTTSVTSYENQFWNSFRLQRPQSIMESFATRLTVSEVRFPWFIPNITPYNNKLWFISGTQQTEIICGVGYYTPAELVIEINQLFNLQTDIPLTQIPVLYYNANTSQYTWTQQNPAEEDQFFCFVDPETVSNTDPDYNVLKNLYASQPSLMYTLGIPIEYCAGNAFGEPFIFEYVGNVTESLYTQYVDLVSNKLNQYTTNLDGTTNKDGSNRVLVRIYLSDEVSIFNNYGNGDLYKPVLIHRQFKNPKNVMFNKNAVVDFIDIQVVDQWNRLVPLPETSYYTAGAVVGSQPQRVVEQGAYPDFQITLLASEN